MAKTRSPGYPVIGLAEAIDKVTRVYEKDYQNKIPRSVLAEHMGYNSLNGKSLGVLSAVSKYGLLEGRGDQNWVSDLALQIIAHEPRSPERLQAIREAAFMPELFAQIQQRFPNGASEPALRSFLLTQKFIPQAAEIAAKSYRETTQLIAAETAGHYSPSEANESGDDMRISREQNIDIKGFTEPGERSQVKAVGEREYLRNQLSPSCEIRLLVKGEIGASELRKLRQLIYLSEAWAGDVHTRPAKADDVDKQLDEASKP
jgi:hypothetical protein